MTTFSAPPKSAQDRLGLFLAQWRTKRISREINSPFLDIACGDNRLARSIDGGVGVDIVDYGQTDHVLKDFYHFPFPPESFATITIIASLNYFEDPAQVLKAAAPLLRLDGKLIVTLLDPMVGTIWHKIREPWAMSPGFAKRDIIRFANIAGLQLDSRRRFMFGLNSIYFLSRSPVAANSN